MLLSFLIGLHRCTKLCQLRLGQPDLLLDLLLLLQLLLQHSAIVFTLSGLSWYATWYAICTTGLVAGRLSSLLVNLLDATLWPVGDRLRDPTCGGRGGGPVWSWWDRGLLSCYYLLMFPGNDCLAELLSIIHKKRIIAVLVPHFL